MMFGRVLGLRVRSQATGWRSGPEWSGPEWSGSGWMAGIVIGLSLGMACGEVPAQAPMTGVTVPKTGLAAPASGPRSITLDVVARDHAGAAVSGLGQGDFGLMDNGRPRAVESFKAFAAGQAPAAPVKVILLVDMVNTNFTNVAYERTEIDKFLRRDGGKLAQPTSLMLFTDTSVQTMQASSTDGNMLAGKLDGSDSPLRTVRRSAGFYGAEERFQLSVDALLRIAGEEKQAPGRKMLVWLSPGWPLLSGPNVNLSSREQEGIFRTIVTVSAALRDARITVYSVDPLGTADAGTLRNFYYKSFLKGVTTEQHVDVGDLGLEVLAVQSGGRALSSNNDVTALIAECYADAAAYYELSFTPAPAERADEYRSIEVRSERPGITMQTRTGYYMQP